ncbi:MAG: hypothetical protein IPO38_06230 [Rhodocyclaceae bacterium]|nr:hypothetical protein [Rhodocyclaceae bacterium]
MKDDDEAPEYSAAYLQPPSRGRLVSERTAFHATRWHGLRKRRIVDDEVGRRELRERLLYVVQGAIDPR